MMSKAGEQNRQAKKSLGIPGEQKENTPSRLKENWIIKRGHALSYAGLFLFTIILYFRP